MRENDMRFVWLPACASLLVGCLAAADAADQAPLTWDEVRARFTANNPTLRAGEIGLDESRADEITAHLRPNPQLSVTADQAALSRPADGSGRFDNVVTVGSVNYLIELGHKRSLRLASARGATAVAISQQADLDRTLVFTLRQAFAQLLQAKAFLAVAVEEIADYDKLLAISRDRLRAGDIAQIDLDRLELQRVAYESDLQTATVNVRTAKIQLIALLNERAVAVEQFDVTGPYDFVSPVLKLEDLREKAIKARPDLRAALQSVEKARTDHRLAVANGTWDPTLGVDVGWPRSAGEAKYFGFGISVPLRLFDRNQGEKKKTELDIDRSDRLADATRAQVVSDVDSAYATLMSTVAQLQPYRDSYLARSTRVRDTVTFSYQRGGAALVDFLQAQQEYRTVQVAYVNLVAAFLNAAAQLNLAVSQEVIP
jgi:cobalt-zinc-cadmium efflux system outer membrane protein